MQKVDIVIVSFMPVSSKTLITLPFIQIFSFGSW